MKKPELTKEEDEVYLKIIARGTMEDMFNFGYIVGCERLITEMLEDLGIKY